MYAAPYSRSNTRPRFDASVLHLFVPILPTALPPYLNVNPFESSVIASL